MSNTELENRIAVLEKEVALLKQKIVKEEKPKEHWWKEIAGTFANLSQREDYDNDEEK
jgi:hypothetical protein